MDDKYKEKIEGNFEGGYRASKNKELHDLKSRVFELEEENILLKKAIGIISEKK